MFGAHTAGRDQAEAPPASDNAPATTNAVQLSSDLSPEEFASSGTSAISPVGPEPRTGVDVRGKQREAGLARAQLEAQASSEMASVSAVFFFDDRLLLRTGNWKNFKFLHFLMTVLSPAPSRSRSMIVVSSAFTIVVIGAATSVAAMQVKKACALRGSYCCDW